MIGIDFTEEMLNKARITAAHYGYNNVEFRQGEIESIPLESNFADYVISNCTINLTQDKYRAFREMFRILKPGGNISVCDNVLQEQFPEKMEIDLDIWTSCVAGALLKQEYLNAISETGFSEVVIIEEKDFDTTNLNIPVSVLSITVKAHKPEG